MSPLAPLETLADTISAAAKVISGYCALGGCPQPSFDPSAPPVTLPHDAPKYVRDARQKLLSAAKEVQQLASEPSEYLPNLEVQYQYIACIKWLGHFQVFAAVPLDGSVPYTSLARICSVPERQLRSVIRMAMTSGCLCEPLPGEVAHNPVSRIFVTNLAYLGWVRFIADFYMPVSSSMAEATEKWGNSEKRTETAANIAMNTSMSICDFITRSREFGNLFSGYMNGISASEGMTVRHLITDFHWARLGNGLVVHIGGAPGSLSIALAEAFPLLRFVVQDSQEKINHSRRLIESQPESIRNCIELSVHEQFDPQPIKDASVYLLRMLLRNQTDAEATRILANLLPVLRETPSARLLIVDTVLSEPGSIGILDEALERYRDMTMKQAFNTKERELQEFHRLLGAVGDGAGRLAIRNIERSPGSVLSSIEVAYQPYENGPIESGIA